MTPAVRRGWLRRALFLEIVSVVWMAAEGGVAIAAGVVAGSLSLEAFGVDSLIEILTALVVLWRLRVEMAPAPGLEDRVEATERHAARLVAVGLLALALYILVEAVMTVWTRGVARPGAWGFIVAVIAAAGMPVLWAAKRRAARALDSEALREDALGNLVCGLMAVILLAGLAAQRAGLWWADPAAALLLGVIVAREGWEAWERGREPTRLSVRAFVGLGSNMGDRAQTLAHALRLLEGPGVSIAARSPVYESPPWGVPDQPRYLNQVVELRTTLSPAELLARCLDVERRLGRVRTTRWGPRTIDLDILLYDEIEMSTPDLTIPHPHLPGRAFMLVPLADLAPGLVLPGGKTVETLLRALPDRGEIREYVPTEGAREQASPAG